MSYYSSYGGAGNSGATAAAAAAAAPVAVAGHERTTRILVVGETGVGKTLLIRRLCDHIFGDTTIEKSAEEVSAFETPRQSRDAVDEDDLGPEWGPTLGIAVDALKRTTTVLAEAVATPPPTMPPQYDSPTVADYSTQSSGVYSMDNGGYSPLSPYGSHGFANRYGGASSGVQYRGQGGGLGANGGPAPAVYHVPAASRLQRQNVLQTVEFHELGGTHGYRDIARLPLRALEYDGIMFVYHRRSLTSTLYLKEWYRWVRGVFSVAAEVGNHNGSGGTGRASKGTKSMPRFMLVGTQLPGDELPAAAAGIGKAVKETLHIASGAISDEALLDGNLEVKLRTLQSPQTPAQRGGLIRALAKLGSSLAWPYHILWCLWHPFFFLSEQYQEERGRRNWLASIGSRVVERFMWLLYQAEQVLLYIMAVILFGPYQESVVLGHTGTKKTLEELLKDEQCVARSHLCRLDSGISLQSSLDELVAFFDVLLRDNPTNEHH
ncbi:hypothetical protein NESM_000112500 [Novymonas esmeraldas]|uniref:Uncharacterized protein n=1 Tax=Novymonas esmeraldas TaxID=1808958 RepID=A0AAW0F413_9TRYP